MSNDLEGQIAHCAARLYAARQEVRAIPPVRVDLPDRDIGAAYRVQQANIRRRLEDGRRVVGRKIGLTAEVVQKQFGIDQPDFGVLLDDMGFYGDDVSIPLVALIAPRIEAEIAFILKADITVAGLRGAELEAAIGQVAASAEIVDSAIAGWDINIVDTVADNASSAAFALGSPQPYVPGMHMRERAMFLKRGDEVISAGTGAATLGHPLTALAWLADTAVNVGEPLRAGEVILSGALGAMKPFEAGDYRIEIDGFPPLAVRAAR